MWKHLVLMPAIDPGRDHHSTIYGHSCTSYATLESLQDKNTPLKHSLWSLYESRYHS